MTRTTAIRTAAVSFSLILAISTPLACLSQPRAAEADPSTQEQLDGKQAEAEAAQSYLTELEGQLNEASNALYETQSSISQTKADIEETQGQVAAAQAQVEAATDDLNQTVTQQYRGNTTNNVSAVLNVLTSATSMEQLVTGITYSQRVTSQQQGAIDGFVAARTELEQQQSTLEQQQADLESLEAQQASEEAGLQEQVSAQQAYYDGLESEVQQLMAQKEAEEAAAAEAARAAAAAAAASSASSASSGTSYGNASGSYAVGTYSSALEAAESRIGCPYVWGAEGPSPFDCSGLVMWAYAQVGVSIPHYSGAQYSSCSYHFYDMGEAQPGDLLFYGSGGSRHVAMYAGGGMMVEAPYTGATVRLTTARTSGGFVGFGRL